MPVARARFLGLVLLPLFAAGPAWGGGWTQPEQGYYARIELVTRSTRRVFAADGGAAAYSIGGGPGSYAATGARGYLEYGLAPGLTALAGLEWKRARITETAARYTTSGFGDLKLGVRLGLAQRSAFPVGVQVEMSVPTGYDDTDVPALGSGQAEALVTAQVGHGFRGGYAAADFGGGRRPKDSAFLIVFGGEVGLNAPAHTVVRLALRGRRAIDPKTTTSRDPAVIERNRLAVSGALSVPLGPRLDLEGGVAGAVSGRNTLRGAEFTLALAAHR